jgi:hypothetical protein
MKPGPLPCGRCGALVDVDWIEVSTLGDPEPSYVPGQIVCPTEGCGTTCPICHRPPGDIHSGACSPFVLAKLIDPCRITRSDCLTAVHALAPLY